MSSAHRAATPLARGRHERGGERSRDAVKARLEVVPPTRTRASSATFALFVGAVLALGLLGLLALNTLLAQGAFATSDLARKQVALDNREESLQQEVAVLESPQQLASAAHRLGMVGTKNPVFLDPVTGKILGVPLAGASPPKPKPTLNSTPSPSTSPGASTPPSTGPTTKPSAGPTTKPTTKPSAGPTTKPTGTR